MLKKENIQILEKVSNWQEAIKVAVQPLIDTGYVEPRYVDGIIENTNKYGPYYVLCEDLALLHAGSDQGVIKKQLAITILREPIRFKADGYNVRVLLTLAADDPESHMDAIRSISTIFSDPKQIKRLVDATSTDDIYEQFMAAAEQK